MMGVTRIRLLACTEGACSTKKRRITGKNDSPADMKSSTRKPRA